MSTTHTAPTPLGLARIVRRPPPGLDGQAQRTLPAQAALVMRVAFDRIVIWTLRIDTGAPEHVVLSGQLDELPYVPDAPPAAAFRLAAVEVLPAIAGVLREAAASTGAGFVELAVPNIALREMTQAVASELGPVQVLPSNAIVRMPVVDSAVADADALYATLLAGRVTQGAQEPQEPAATLEVATDASARRHRAPSAAAWVRSDGMFATEIIDTADISVAELAAIQLAVDAHSRHRGELVVMSDSREAIAMARDALAGEVNSLTSAGRRFQRRLAESPMRGSVRLVWVKGHRDHLLNQIADELAVMARRHHDVGLSPSEHRVRARKTVLEGLGLEQGTGAA